MVELPDSHAEHESWTSAPVDLGPSGLELESGAVEELAEGDRAEVLAEYLEQAYPVFNQLAAHLAEDIALREWDAVIGDDKSGRLPALFVGLLVNTWRSANNLPAAKRLFVAAGSVGDLMADDMASGETMNIFGEGSEASDLRQSRLDDRVEEDPGFDGIGRALIVTEYIESGQSILRLGRALELRSIGYDVATLESAEDDVSRVQPDQDADTKLYIGRSDVLTYPLLHPDPDRPDPNYGESYDFLVPAIGVKRDPNSAVSQPDPEADRKLMAVARQKIAEMAERAYEDNEFWDRLAGEDEYDRQVRTSLA